MSIAFISHFFSKHHTKYWAGMIMLINVMVFNIMMVPYTPTTYSSVHIFQSKNNILFVVYVSMALAGRGNITTFSIMEKGKEAFFAALTTVYIFGVSN